MMTETNDDGLTFAQWLDRANHACRQISGLTLNDLPDSNTYDAWSDGESPRDHAIQVLTDEGFPFPPPGGTADEVRSVDIRTGSTYEERRATGQAPANRHVRQALNARKVLGHLPILY